MLGWAVHPSSGSLCQYAHNPSLGKYDTDDLIASIDRSEPTDPRCAGCLLHWPSTMPPFITTDDACKALGVSKPTIFRWLRRGVLQRYKRMGDTHTLIDQAELEALRRSRPRVVVDSDVDLKDHDAQPAS